MNEELLNYVNEKINNLTKYGYRNVTTRKRGYKLSWSNNRMKWYPTGRVLPAGTYKLDANEVMVEAPSTEIEEILPFLNELPLYSNSTEARKRDSYSPVFKEYYEDYPEDRKKKSSKAKPKRKIVKKKKGCGCK